jgi:predicted phosphodiesterase
MSKRIFWFISIAISVAFVVWFYLGDGVAGLAKWEIKYRMYLIYIIVACVLQVLFALLSVFWAKKEPSFLKIFANVMATLLCVVFIGGIAVVNILGSLTPEADGKLNLLHSGETLPMKKNSALISHIAIASDPHWNVDTANEERRNEIMDRIASSGYDAFFCLGDIAEIGAIPDAYVKPVNDFAKHLGNMPLRVIRGNHDALVNTRKKFGYYFGPEGKYEPYFRISGNGIHCLFLNLLWGTEDWTAAQEDWLVSELETIPQNETVVVFSHCFYFGSGSRNEESGVNWYDIPDMIEKVTPIFKKYNVDLVVSGHNHSMEFLKDENVSYAIIGAMGGKPDDGNLTSYISPKSLWNAYGEHGWIDLQVYEDKLSVIFMRYNGEPIYHVEIPTK